MNTPKDHLYVVRVDGKNIISGWPGLTGSREETFTLTKTYWPTKDGDPPLAMKRFIRSYDTEHNTVNVYTYRRNWILDN